MAVACPRAVKQPRRSTASRPARHGVARDLELPEVLGQFPDKVAEEILGGGRRGSGAGPYGPGHRQ